MGREALIPALLASLAFARGEPAAEEVATVAFSADGAVVAMETRWVDEGPGFPNAKIELRRVADGELLGTWAARLTEGSATSGFDGASRAVRADADPALRAAGVDLDHPATPFPCTAGTCGPSTPAAGCARGRDTLRVTVTSTPVSQKVDQCYGRGTPDLLQVTVHGRSWVAETSPADGCPADYAAQAVYLHGESAALLLGYTVPGHEGRVPRPLVLTGRTR